MFCEKCGNKLNTEQQFCSNCGHHIKNTPDPVEQIPPTQNQDHADQTNQTHTNFSYQPNTLVGFSPKISDPVYKKLINRRNKSTIIFAFIASAIAIVASHIAGIYKEDMAFPKSLFLGLGLSVFFLFFAFYQSIKSKSDKTWDGSVVDKRSFKKRVRNDDNTSSYTWIYQIKVKRDDDGKIFKHDFNSAAGVYNYYEIGDRVRHHKGLYLYEKYDKSHDSDILCVSCAQFSNISADVCKRCKCQLLK
ncbi:MAG: zinc ribbon domain-containing protein [Clostridiales bacterium]|nr:zinc ribbon domain-containing protein [Clostridiales bacterium]